MNIYPVVPQELNESCCLFQNAKVDEWMEKMNTEFSEIEGFELSIEDNA